jgi:NitT/TauT family transport system substrate-binding protein
VKRGTISRRTALAAAGAAFVAPAVGRAQSPPPPALHLAGVPEDSITPALYADQAGLFKRAGISVQISPERSGAAIAAGIAGGAFDIAKSSIVGLIVAHSKGIPFVLVAPGGVATSSSPIVGMLVKPDSPIKVPADLSGKTVAVSALGDIYALATMAWVEKGGGNAASVKQLEFPVGAVPAAVAAGRVDAGAVIEPVLQSAVDSGNVRVIGHPFDAIAPRFLYSAWFATADWTTQHAAQATAFHRALRDAAIYANAHKAQTVEMLAKYTSIDASVIAHMTRAEYGTVLDPALLQPLVDACAKYKLIPVAYDARDLIAPIFRT